MKNQIQATSFRKLYGFEARAAFLSKNNELSRNAAPSYPLFCFTGAIICPSLLKCGFEKNNSDTASGCKHHLLAG